ncbi:hypothetical protein O1611_g502 [Lasiodiplodia mahajangana]|uniref:Uncharacterized protein n=1 Tax=Lasiodiplodia mahajangana TaxID=1108764 RepID=A0ACC2K0Y9_9PEZI|nr:hypothetical protein O1611_g502 [Lasiodiplodia mahajangana]
MRDGKLTPTTPGWALTTVFTAPTECVTPFITVPGVGCDDVTCYALFMPSLEIDSATGGAHIQCLPSFSTDSDFNMSPIFSYSPGIFCPSGMSRASSVPGTAICCPSGLDCTDVGTNGTTSYKCTATLTTGKFGQGDWGENVGYYSSLTVLSPELHQTIYAEATPIVLLRRNLRKHSSPVISSSATISTIASSAVRPSPSGASDSRPGSNSAVIVGGVLGSVAFILFIVLVHSLARYRRGRVLARNNQSHIGTEQEQGTIRMQQNPSDDTRDFWSLKPEPDPTATRVELEGTAVDHQGPGIYVAKPELEGTAGKNRLFGVFVRGKAELEGNGPGR